MFVYVFACFCVCVCAVQCPTALSRASAALSFTLSLSSIAALAMAKNGANTEAKAKAQTITLWLPDPRYGDLADMDLFSFGLEGEFPLKMDQTLEDLADMVKEDWESWGFLHGKRWISLKDLADMTRKEDWPFLHDGQELPRGGLEWLCFTTLEGELMPPNVTMAKLIQDGLISDGQRLVPKRVRTHRVL
jgi:hypothetical protein